MLIPKISQDIYQQICEDEIFTDDGAEQDYIEDMLYVLENHNIHIYRFVREVMDGSTKAGLACLAIYEMIDHEKKIPYISPTKVNHVVNYFQKHQPSVSGVMWEWMPFFDVSSYIYKIATMATAHADHEQVLYIATAMYLMYRILISA